MIVLEFFAILTALLTESISLQVGSIKPLTKWLTRKPEAGEDMSGVRVSFQLRLMAAFLLWTGSFLYLIYGMVWCFSPSFPIQVSGMILIGLSVVSWLGFRARGLTQPVWFRQLDSAVSLACVTLIAIVRIRGL